MPPKIRIADGLQSTERLIATAGAIIKGMTGNPSFPSPPSYPYYDWLKEMIKLLAFMNLECKL